MFPKMLRCVALACRSNQRDQIGYIPRFIAGVLEIEFASLFAQCCLTRTRDCVSVLGGKVRTMGEGMFSHLHKLFSVS
jgi:membrane glycosyltransferase